MTASIEDLKKATTEAAPKREADHAEHEESAMKAEIERLKAENAKLQAQIESMKGMSVEMSTLRNDFAELTRRIDPPKSLQTNSTGSPITATPAPAGSALLLAASRMVGANDPARGKRIEEQINRFATSGGY